METLTKTAEGRLIVHTFVLCNNCLHFRNPNLNFYFSACFRYFKGIG